MMFTITTGSSAPARYEMASAISEIPGDDDEVIVTDPGFASHLQQIKLCGAHPVYWPLLEEKGWSLDIDALEGLITAKTKAIVLVSPSNPTGTIFTETQLRQVAALAAAHNIFILIDDPYHHFCYENRARYFNLASDKGLPIFGGILLLSETLAFITECFGAFDDKILGMEGEMVRSFIPESCLLEFLGENGMHVNLNRSINNMGVNL